MKPDRVTKDAKAQDAKGKDEPGLPSPKRSSGFAQAGHAGHRQRLKARFLKGGAEALPDYEMLELLLFQALPRRDTKRLAKALLKRFGSFPEVISAEPGALKEIDSIGDGDIVTLKTVQAAVAILGVQGLHSPLLAGETFHQLGVRHSRNIESNIAFDFHLLMIAG